MTVFNLSFLLFLLILLGFRLSHQEDPFCSSQMKAYGDCLNKNHCSPLCWCPQCADSFQNLCNCTCTHTDTSMKHPECIPLCITYSVCVEQSLSNSSINCNDAYNKYSACMHTKHNEDNEEGREYFLQIQKKQQKNGKIV